MLIPKFEITQTDEDIILTIQVPHIKVSESELIVEDGTKVSFFCKPYLLKLNLPRRVLEDDKCSAKYDPLDRNGVIIATLPKLERGEVFPNLEFPSALLIQPSTISQIRFHFS